MEWIIQNGLNDGYKIVEACETWNIPYTLIDYKPFSRELPEPDYSRSVMFYGSAGLVEAVEKSEDFWPGVISVDGSWINLPVSLNKGRVMALGSVIENYPMDRFFIRPVADDKLFSGQVISWAEMLKWHEHLVKMEMNQILETKVLVSSVKTIQHEWRCFMVGGQFITGSHYCAYGQKMLSPDVPQEVIEFVETHTFPPHIYVIDVAQFEDKLYILELNGFNSCGFYESDVTKLVKEIEDSYA